MTERNNRVSRIRISPFKFVGYLNEAQIFTALGVDANGEIVHGAKFSWETSDRNILTIDDTGRATFLQPGQARLICRAGAAQGEAIYGGPTFTQRTETATNAPNATYAYSTSSGVYVITRPDNSTLRLTPGSLGITQSEIRTSGGTTVAKTVYTYANDAGGQPQVQTITSYDDTNTASKVDFSYDQYGNITDKREYGNQIGGQWKVRRRTHNTYVPYQQYVDAYLRSLLQTVEIYDAQENTNDGDDVLIAKTEYQYDNTTVTTYSGANPPGYIASYNGTTHGNPTTVKEWTNISSNTFDTHTRNYDMFGNRVKEQISCCNEKSYTFGQNTYWSKAEQATRGNTSGIYLTDAMSYSFNSGNLQTNTDPNGQITAYSYGSGNLLTGTTSPTGATNSTSYNGWGLPSSTTQQYVEGGVTKTITTSTVYDGWGQAIQEINEHGGQVNMAYNNLGRMTSRTHPFQAGGTPAPATTYQYDTLGRGTVITTPDSNTVTTAYNGKITTVTDQVNRKIKREVDSLGRLIKVTEQEVTTGALSQETAYTYDMADRLTQVNQGGQIRSFKYDAAGHLLYEKIPEQTATINDGTGTLWTMKYAYTDFGAVATRTDARGVITTYSYDSLNRLTSISYNTSGASGVAATPTITYTYDNNQTSIFKGLLLSVTVGTGYSETYTYSNIGQGNGANGGDRLNLQSLAYNIEGKNYSTSYQYNQANQRTQIGHLYPEYDNKGRLLKLKNSSGVAWLSNVAYNNAGQVTGDTLNTSGTVINETFGYDTNRMQLTSQTATKGATSLLNLTYNYAAAAGQNGVGSTAGNSGQLMSISGTINSTTESASYTYDLLSRLVTSYQTTNATSAQRRFAYDRWGNRTGMWDATTGGNQIQSITLQQSGGTATNRITSVTQGATLNYTYDNAGNVTSDGQHSYVFDAENRIVAADSGASVYAYDHKNRRVKKTVGATITHYVWEGFQVLAEHNGATGAVITRYINTGSKLIAKIENGNTRYFLSDRLSARVVLDASGTVVGRQAHLPFGEELGVSGESDKHRFTSYERDSEIGLDYAVNRYYSLAIGRFETVDPLLDKGFKAAKRMTCGGNKGNNHYQQPQKLSRYSYVVNDPILLTDPRGLNAQGPCQSPNVPFYCPPEFSSCEFDRCGNPIDADGSAFGGGGGCSCPGTTSCNYYRKKCKTASGAGQVSYYCVGAQIVCRAASNTCTNNCRRFYIQLMDTAYACSISPSAEAFYACQTAAHITAFEICNSFCNLP
ncbi:MAG: RHS repeat-associated core domain-containing protein [Acidobacteriota bacterium]